MGWRNPLEGVNIGTRAIASLTNLVPILFLLCKTLDKPLAVWTFLPRYVFTPLVKQIRKLILEN